jgi:hypothetical protein
MTEDRYGRWRRRLDGEALPIHPDHPEPGFYRVRTRDKTRWRPIAYWIEGERMVCHLDGQPLEFLRACEIWPFAVTHPVTWEAYQTAVQTGAWPDEHPAVTRSNNAPPDHTLEALREQIDDLCREAGKIAEGDLVSPEDVDRVADLAIRLGDLEKAASDRCKEEKAPHAAVARRIRDEWSVPIAQAASAKKTLKHIIAGWLIRHGLARAGARGRVVSLRTIRHAKIVDYRACLQHFSDDRAIVEIVQALADAAVRHGDAPPGCNVEKEVIAA